MTDSFWDDPDLKQNDNYISFDAVGDKASGTIVKIHKHTFPASKDQAEKTVPQLLLACDDGEERTLTAGQTKLKLALLEARPAVGDHLTIELTQIEKRGGGRTLKHFDVKVATGGAQPVAPAEPAATPAPAPDMAAAAAAVANLTPEQKEALGIPA